jgi:glycerophosphoryl diester phosphodiesterase
MAPMMDDNLPRPLIVAHRGFSSRYPENTMAAFRAAIDSDAHMIELDVNLSKDRQLVVIHDETVDRTTNGSGRVSALTGQQLGRLDAGSWFDPIFKLETIPTLDQVLAAVKGHLLVNIEIKPEAYERHAPADAVERQVLSMVKKRQMTEAVIISSFEWRLLERLRRLDASIAIGLLAETPMDNHVLDWFDRVKGFSWHPDCRVLTRPQVDALHAFGARVYPYAVAGRIDVAGMLAMGADGLILDDPGQVRPALSPNVR